MKIEYLFSEVACLFGEHANVMMMQRSVPGAEVIHTPLSEKPRFLTEDDIDVVYMGTMTESAQKTALERLMPYRDEIWRKIENGQCFLVTGNALELFGKRIEEKGDVRLHGPYYGSFECLGLFDFHTERDMLHRFDSLALVEYGGKKLTGLRSQFTKSLYDGEVPALFDVVRGPGFDNSTELKKEGVHYKNFYATYMLGPLFVMNPLFLKNFLAERGAEEICIPFESDIVDAYEDRVREYSDPSTGYVYL